MSANGILGRGDAAQLPRRDPECLECGHPRSEHRGHDMACSVDIYSHDGNDIIAACWCPEFAPSDSETPNNHSHA